VPESTGEARPGLREAAAVAALLLVAVLVTLVTYSRIEPAELYHVSVDGLPGGLGRALVELNYPVALIAIAFVPLAVDRLRAAGRRWAAPVGTLAAALCLLVAVAVRQADMDARAVNVLPAVGVALALALGIAAYREGGVGVAGEPRGDRLRFVLVAALVLAAIPWLFAELGFYAPDPYMADEPSPDEPLRAVHLGSHEGMDGVLCALAALGLSRQLARFHAARLAHVAAALLSLLLAYGVANETVDGWNEQVWKRGSTDEHLDGVALPSLSWSWAAIVGLAVLVFVLWFGREAAYSSPRSQSRHSDIGT
jgi:hypothetical protein